MKKSQLAKEIRKKQVETAIYHKFDPDDYFKDGHFVSKYLADDISGSYIFACMNDRLYCYDNGIYVLVEDVIQGIVNKRLGERFTTNRFNETLFYLKSANLAKKEDLPINYINLRNGLYNIETDTLEDHDSKYFTITQINAEYHEEAWPELFLKFLYEVVNEDDAQIIQEWFGYCLYRDYPFHKALMCIGDGANGKSTLIDVLRNFIGCENCANIPLQQLSERFAATNLIGKMVNYYSDLSSKAFSKTGLFKILTGQDTLMSEQKFKQDWIQFKNYAKLTFSCNKLPQVSGDDSDAFYRRWIFVNFPNRFEGKNADSSILKTLDIALERNGLFKWSLEGLKRLMSQSTFSHSKTTDDLRTHYDRLSSPVKSFIMDMIEFSADSQIPKQELYGKFIEYCKKSNLPGISKDKFFKDLAKEGNIRTERPQILGKQVWCCVGVRYKKNIEFNKNDPDDVDLVDYL